MRYLQLKNYLTKNFHRMRVFLCIILLFLLSNIATTAQTEKQYAIRTIAFYNVENLFDYEDDPLIWDNDWTPNGKNNWTKENYKRSEERRVGKECRSRTATEHEKER